MIFGRVSEYEHKPKHANDDLVSLFNCDASSKNVHDVLAPTPLCRWIFAGPVCPLCNQVLLHLYLSRRMLCVCRSAGIDATARSELPLRKTKKDSSSSKAARRTRPRAHLQRAPYFSHVPCDSIGPNSLACVREIHLSQFSMYNAQLWIDMRNRQQKEYLLSFLFQIVSACMYWRHEEVEAQQNLINDGLSEVMIDAFRKQGETWCYQCLNVSPKTTPARPSNSSSDGYRIWSSWTSCQSKREGGFIPRPMFFRLFSTPVRFTHFRGCVLFFSLGVDLCISIEFVEQC